MKVKDLDKNILLFYNYLYNDKFLNGNKEIN